MSLLERFPGEVLAEGVRFLDPATFLRLRLVNKSISIIMHNVFLRRFFRHRSVFISTDSLEILRQVSLSERYRASVTSLVVCVHHIPEAHYDLELEDIRSPARSMAASDHPQYTILLREQKIAYGVWSGRCLSCSSLEKFTKLRYCRNQRSNRRSRSQISEVQSESAVDYRNEITGKHRLREATYINDDGSNNCMSLHAGLLLHWSWGRSHRDPATSKTCFCLARSSFL